MADALELIRGTLDVLVLKALSHEAMHGYGITRWIRDATDGVLGVEDAALYQAVHRLERRGLIESEWGVTENNRKAKYYQLTPRGRRELKSSDAVWRRYAAAVFRVLDTKRA